MGVRWEGKEMPEEYDREFMVEILNNHAQGIARVHQDQQALAARVVSMANVVWKMAEKEFPELVAIAKDQIASEKAMGSIIDQIFKEFGNDQS